MHRDGRALLALVVAAAVPALAGLAHADPCPEGRRRLRVGTASIKDTVEWVALQGELDRFAREHCVTPKIVQVLDPVGYLADERGEPIDIVITAQPATLVALHALGKVHPLPASAEAVARTYGIGAVRLGSSPDGVLLAVPTDGTLKSMVWARADTFTASGLNRTQPTTWEALIALTDDLAIATGEPPWAIMMNVPSDWRPEPGADGGEGWPGTDWIEDILLHTCGPAVYDDIFKHRVRFDDACMKEAWKTFGAIARDPARVAGGIEQMLVRWFQDLGGLARPVAINSYLAENYTAPADVAVWGTAPAPARLHHQASFFAYIARDAYWNAIGPDGEPRGAEGFLGEMDWFPTPAPEASEFRDAAVVAGSLACVVGKRPEVGKLFIDFLMSDAYGHEISKLAGVVVPNLSFDAYPADPSDPIVGLNRRLAETYHAAMRSGAVSFDGSDLMPYPVDKAFRYGLLEFLGTPRNPATDDALIERILAEIEATW